MFNVRPQSCRAQPFTEFAGPLQTLPLPPVKRPDGALYLTDGARSHSKRHFQKSCSGIGAYCILKTGIIEERNIQKMNFEQLFKRISRKRSAAMSLRCGKRLLRSDRSRKDRYTFELMQKEREITHVWTKKSSGSDSLKRILTGWIKPSKQ